MRFIGFIAIKMQKLLLLCISKYLTSSINNNGGIISGLVSLSNPKNITIGKGSYINGGQIFAGSNSKIIIGNNVMISYNVHIRTWTHNYKDTEIPIIMQGGYEKDIVIEDNCWIGHSVHIMPGVTIKKNSVIGANAVVTHDVEANSVMVGVPAKLIRKRN